MDVCPLTKHHRSRSLINIDLSSQMERKKKDRAEACFLSRVYFLSLCTSVILVTPTTLSDVVGGMFVVEC